MIINIDKYLIHELNDAGFDLTYDKMIYIYQKSRKRLDYLNNIDMKRTEEEKLKKYYTYKNQF